MNRTAPVLLLAALLALSGCSLGLQGARGGIGHVTDDAVRLYLEPATLLGDGACNIRFRAGVAPMRCRAFRGTAGDHLLGVYDPLTDILLVLFAIDDDGRQHVVWRPRSTPPDVQVEGVSL